ncbi:hypothetical protein AB0L63_10700 [Nocardia sp. NPDC051990]
MSAIATEIAGMLMLMLMLTVMVVSGYLAAHAPRSLVRVRGHR